MLQIRRQSRDLAQSRWNFTIGTAAQLDEPAVAGERRERTGRSGTGGRIPGYYYGTRWRSFGLVFVEKFFTEGSSKRGLGALSNDPTRQSRHKKNRPVECFNLLSTFRILAKWCAVSSALWN